MKRILNFILSRHPSLYRRVLRTLHSSNTEKMTFLKLVKDGDIVFDIGANRGDFTVLFSHIAGRLGGTHAFEPVPPTFSRLTQRIAAECHFQNVTLNDFALGDTTGSFEIHVPSGDFGQASLKNHEAASWSKPGRASFNCEVRTLDAYVAERQLGKVDLIKIDVEGGELPVLRGGQRAIAEFHPIIHLEYFARWTEAFGYGAGDLIAFLRAQGYEYFYTGEFVPLVSPVEQIEANTESQNVVCSISPLSVSGGAIRASPSFPR